MKVKTNQLLLYMAKCVSGGIIVFILSYITGFTDISWCLISVVLVLSPDNKEALPLAFTRIKANLAGSAASLLCLLLGIPNLFTLTLAFVMAISFCYLFKAMAGSRSSLAAVIIIMLHHDGLTSLPSWETVLERVLSVIIGCSLGLLITLLFHRRLNPAPVEIDVSDD